MKNNREEIILKIAELENKLKEVKGTECEVYSRIVGYFRPVKAWNNGKREEYSQRETFETKTPVSKV
jgi:ribonucleoside-triphosphate reductase